MWPEAEALLPIVDAPEVLFRIGRIVDPWRASFRSADPDGAFSGNRFDDSERHYGVLYTGSTRVGCFVETLAYYRRTALRKIQNQLEASITEIADGEPVEPLPSFGTVPASWLFKRQMGAISGAGKRFADVCHSEWISYLRQELEGPLSEWLPNRKFDLSDVMSRDRRISQRASTVVHALEVADGIAYPSRHGRDFLNFALFEPCSRRVLSEQRLLEDDSDFRKALLLLGLALDPAS